MTSTIREKSLGMAGTEVDPGITVDVLTRRPR